MAERGRLRRQYLGPVLIENAMTFVCDCRNIISHLDQAELEQYAQMIGSGGSKGRFALMSRRASKLGRSLEEDRPPICHPLGVHSFLKSTRGALQRLAPAPGR